MGYSMTGNGDGVIDNSGNCGCIWGKHSSHSDSGCNRHQSQKHCKHSNEFGRYSQTSLHVVICSGISGSGDEISGIDIDGTDGTIISNSGRIVGSIVWSKIGIGGKSMLGTLSGSIGGVIITGGGNGGKVGMYSGISISGTDGVGIEGSGGSNGSDVVVGGTHIMHSGASGIKTHNSSQIDTSSMIGGTGGGNSISSDNTLFSSYIG